MSRSIEERVWAYLDASLPPSQVEALERDLLDPAVAQVFAEALMLRELLRDVGPAEAPPRLIMAAETAVQRDLRRANPEPRRFQRVRAALGGLSWATRGPQLALTGSLQTTRNALNEIGNARYTLGPLAARESDSAAPPPATRRRSLWRRLLRRRK